MKFSDKLKSFKPFPEQVAWSLFKYAAIGEAVGWTLLIPAVIMDRYKLPGYHDAIIVAGQTHGMLFIFYLFIVLAGFNSLSWSLKRTAVAVAVSVPPYGTLIFEQWAAKERRKALRQSYRRIMVRAIINRGDELLAIQTGDSADYCLPGGYIEAKETGEQALARVLLDLTGTKATIGPLRFVKGFDDHNDECLEFYFDVANAKAYHSLDLESVRLSHSDIDVIRFVQPLSTSNLEPIFLQKESFDGSSKQADLRATFVS